ncbi:hypothetical protein E2562_018984 [Oryza meyeriana var. granulata]|uniref:Uncharacterized protein n=1 Tax=Oryza meyeriana var. granulata TaxID=110450 RepID=A0A6G1DK08_9ORYZ|nr:hypothetical protein E2562_018984 [Oryza meyeriana var. granulata]
MNWAVLTPSAGRTQAAGNDVGVTWVGGRTAGKGAQAARKAAGTAGKGAAVAGQGVAGTTAVHSDGIRTTGMGIWFSPQPQVQPKLAVSLAVMGSLVHTEQPATPESPTTQARQCPFAEGFFGNHDEACWSPFRLSEEEQGGGGRLFELTAGTGSATDDDVEDVSRTPVQQMVAAFQADVGPVQSPTVEQRTVMGSRDGPLDEVRGLPTTETGVCTRPATVPAAVMEPQATGAVAKRRTDGVGTGQLGPER